MRDERFYTYTPTDLLSVAQNFLSRIDIRRDTFPNGLSVAMAPLLVDWKSSSIGSGPEDFYVLRNVNLSIDPVSGYLTLGSIRVPADSVEHIEWVFVVSRVARRETEGGHAMLRFVFKEDRLPTLISNEGDPIGHNIVTRDLVFSWEAWRPPLANFDPVSGLTPDTYALSLRCCHGPMRCLSDSLLDRPWVCYPIRLPDVPNAAHDFLYVAMLLGDAVARQTIGSIIEERIEANSNIPEGYEDEDLEQWDEMHDAIRDNAIPDFPIDEILEGKTRYHLLERSCVTMALATLDLANVRIHKRAGLEVPPRIKVVPGELPSFINHLAEGKRRSALLAIPAAIHWFARNQTVIPGRAHELLDKVGLLRQENQKILKSHFDNRQNTPYGRLHENLIY